jgi:hypothetical protein
MKTERAFITELPRAVQDFELGYAVEFKAR